MTNHSEIYRRLPAGHHAAGNQPDSTHRLAHSASPDKE